MVLEDSAECFVLKVIEDESEGTSATCLQVLLADLLESPEKGVEPVPDSLTLPLLVNWDHFIDAEREVDARFSE